MAGIIERGEVVAIVPTKMTSVRLPQKNTADLGGQPLFVFSVRAAQACNDIDAVYVSSESEKVLDLAQCVGAATIHRPKELSAPHVTNLHVLLHALEAITEERGKQPEFVVLLQPTHPLREPARIADGIAAMRANSEADLLITVISNDDMRGEIVDGWFVPEFPLPRDKTKEPRLFRNTGSFYIARVATTLARGRMYGGQVLPLVLDHPEFEVDVDEASDLAMARCVFAAHQEVFSVLISENTL